MRNQNGLTAKFFAANRERLRKAYKGTAPVVMTANYSLQKSADAAYPFVQETNFWYLTGISEPGVILVMDNEQEYLILPVQNAVQATFDGPLDPSQVQAVSGIKQLYTYHEGWAKLEKRLRKTKQVASLQPATPFIESLGMFTNPSRSRLIEKMRSISPALELIDLRMHLARLRMIKTPEEIQIVRGCVAHTIELFGIIEQYRDKVEKENELLAELQKYVTAYGLTFGYDPIIASGDNALTLHYIRNNAVLEKKKFMLADIGASQFGYSADLTRSITSHPTKRQQAVYDAVVAVHEFAVSLLRPGAELKSYEREVHTFMGEKLRELGLIKKTSPEEVGKYYPHSTSHFLGLDVHDVGDYELPLRPGTLLTVEPGIYIKEESIAIRIEDNIMITENGYDNLSSRLPKCSTSLTISPNAS